MASGEFALEPKPLSLNVRNVPSLRFLIPDSPWTGWPFSGKLTPVGRGAALSDSADVAGMVSGASTRWSPGPA